MCAGGAYTAEGLAFSAPACVLRNLLRDVRECFILGGAKMSFRGGRGLN